MFDLPLILLTVAAGLCVLMLLASYICYLLTFNNSGKDRDNPHSEIKLASYAQFKTQTTALINEISAAPYEKLEIKSYDGLTLFGRYYHFSDGAPIEIQIHGYKGHAYRDFCGGARDARARGHNLILVDQRAHGKSGGKTISFGINERHDCLSWVNYAARRFGEDSKIFLIGMSMGAATVLMASELPLPKNVVGIMADCPYSSPNEIIKKVIKTDLGLPVLIFYPFVRLGGRLFGGFDIESASAEDAVASSRVPILILHGERDSFVPCEMSEKIFTNVKAADSKRVTFPDADHGMSYLCHKDAYLREVESFMAAALSSAQ